MRGVDLELLDPDHRAKVRSLSLVTAEGGPPSPAPTELRLYAERVHLEHPRPGTKPGDLAAVLLHSPPSVTIQDLRFGGERVPEVFRVGQEGLERGALNWYARLEVFGGPLASREAWESGPRPPPGQRRG